MLLSQVGAQLYTVRKHLGSVEQINQTLARIKEIGYGLVELIDVSNFMSDQDLARCLGDHGLKAWAMHFHSQDILERPLTVIDRMSKLGIKIAIYPFPTGRNLKYQVMGNAAGFAKELETVAETFRQARKTLAYHNHEIEFMRVGPGQTVLDVLFKETRALKFELDTHWVQRGGGNPVQWCRKLGSRMQILHLKDYAVIDRKIVFAEVGSGNLDWAGIITAADKAGCKCYVVEQDECPGNPFDSLSLSYNYIKDHLAL